MTVVSSDQRPQGDDPVEDVAIPVAEDGADLEERPRRELPGVLRTVPWRFFFSPASSRARASNPASITWASPRSSWALRTGTVPLPLRYCPTHPPMASLLHPSRVAVLPPGHGRLSRRRWP